MCGLVLFFSPIMFGWGGEGWEADVTGSCMHVRTLVC